jgi:hypothetical protein
VRQDETLCLREPAVRGVGNIVTKGRVVYIFSREIAVNRNIHDRTDPVSASLPSPRPGSFEICEIGGGSARVATTEKCMYARLGFTHVGSVRSCHLYTSVPSSNLLMSSSTS